MQEVISIDPKRQEILEQIKPFAEAALIHEAMGKKGALCSSIKAAYQGAKVCGFALPVKSLPGDNLMLHKAISIAKPGDVLLAAVSEFTEAGLWGEIASVAAMERGIKGLVTDGAVRDIEQISQLGFPVFSKGLSIKGTTKRQKGTINEPIVIGNVQVNAGDIIIGDTDGVVVIPVEDIADTISVAKMIKSREEEIIQKIRKGGLTIDLLGLRQGLADLGIDE